MYNITIQNLIHLKKFLMIIYIEKIKKIKEITNNFSDREWYLKKKRDRTKNTVFSIEECFNKRWTILMCIPIFDSNMFEYTIHNQHHIFKFSFHKYNAVSYYIKRIMQKKSLAYVKC